MSTTMHSYQEGSGAQKAQALNFLNVSEDVNTQDILNDENFQSVTSLLNSLTSDLEALLQETGLDPSKTDMEHLEEALPESVKGTLSGKLEELEGELKSLLNQFNPNDPVQDNHNYGAASKSAIAMMMEILSLVENKMNQSLTQQVLLEGQELMANAQEQLNNLEQSQKGHHFLGKLVKGLTYAAQAVTVVALCATGNVAAALAVAVLSVAMDTKMAQKVSAGLQELGVPAVAADLIAAAVVITLVVASFALGNVAAAGEVGAEVGSQAGLQGAVDAAASEGEAAAADSVEDSVSKGAEKEAKSQAKAYVGLTVMSGSSALMQDNFALDVAKNINNKTLKEIVGISLLLLEIAGAIAGGGAALSGAADTQGLNNLLSSLSELTGGAIPAEVDSIESVSQVISKIATIAGASINVVNGSLEIGIAGHQVKMAELTKNLDLMKQTQATLQNMINDQMQELKQNAQSFENLFESFEFNAPADAMSAILAGA
ncbi:MAG: hypothetical protein AB7N99_08690 [Simkaniaceae bacterium]